MMGRRVDDKSLLARFAVEFSRVVERFTEYIIVSGFVVIVSGRARGTEDVDMIIRPVAKEKFASLHEALLKAGFVCLQSDKVEEIYSYFKEYLKSEKDLEDASHLRRVYVRDIDEEEIKKIRKMLKEVRMKDEG